MATQTVFATSARSTPVRSRALEPLYFVQHESFESIDAEDLYGGPPAEDISGLDHMHDDVTRDAARRMHYAAWRSNHAVSEREHQRWRRRYFEQRDRIVLGNRKLIFRAVRKWGAALPYADDMASECQIVLIQAVAAYNPWMGIRFSTYAFTCLMRALSRLTQRLTTDRLARSLPLDSLPDGEPRQEFEEEPASSILRRLDEYLQEGHTLLTAREKIILIRRFCLHEENQDSGTLEEVGRELGLSKERVRQVQMSALGKLRGAMVGTPSVA